MLITPIATYHCIFTSKFGIPRQSGLIKDIHGQIVFEKDFRNPEFVRGLTDYDYLWLIWGFSENKHKISGSTVRPPRLGGNKRMGVFATRSPYRPNPLGLSSVRIDSVISQKDKGTIINVSGGDLMDGTPIYDIKPYLEFTDSHTNISNGFVDTIEWKKLDVIFENEAYQRYNECKRHLIRQILQEDPRPQYHDDTEKIYKLTLGDEDIQFKIIDTQCVVL